MRTGADLKGDVDLGLLDLPLCPGAKHEGSTNIATSSGRLVAAKLTTSASFEDVEAFYRARYPDAVAKPSSGTGGKALLLTVHPAPDLRTVRITAETGLSHITVDLMRQVQEGPAKPGAGGAPRNE